MKTKYYLKKKQLRGRDTIDFFEKKFEFHIFYKCKMLILHILSFMWCLNYVHYIINLVYIILFVPVYSYCLYSYIIFET